MKGKTMGYGSLHQQLPSSAIYGPVEAASHLEVDDGALTKFTSKQLVRRSASTCTALPMKLHHRAAIAVPQVGKLLGCPLGQHLRMGFHRLQAT